MIRLTTYVLMISLFMAPQQGWSQSGYDAIIDDLTSRQSTRTQRNLPPPDVLSDVNIYLGAGWVNTFFQPVHSDSQSVLWNSGVVLTLGIDLFSTRWMAEGSLKNFGTTTQGLHEYQLKDFDLKLVRQSAPGWPVRSRWGLGVGGRYLEHRGPEGSSSYSTPYAMALAGLSAVLSSHLQIGAEVAARTSLIQETVDRNSVDLALKLDTFF